MKKKGKSENNGIIDAPKRPGMSLSMFKVHVLCSTEMIGSKRWLFAILTASVTFFPISCADSDKNNTIVTEFGVADLSGLDSSGVSALKGDWEVYPGEALTPPELEHPLSRNYAAVPPRHGRFYTRDGYPHITGVVTYRIVLKNVLSASPAAVRLPPMYSSHIAWVNSVPIFGRILPLSPDKHGTATLVMQTKPSYYPFGGMNHRPPLVGLISGITEYTMATIFRDGLFIGALLLLGLYHLLLTFGPHRDNPTLCLAVLAIVLAGRVFFTNGELLFSRLVPLSNVALTRLMGFTIYPVPALYLRFIRRLFPLETGKMRFLVMERVLWGMLAASVVVPIQWWADLLYAGIVVITVTAFFIATSIVRAVLGKRNGSVLVASGLVVNLVFVFTDVAAVSGYITLHASVASLGFVVFTGLNSLAVFLRIADFRISLANLREQAERDGLTGLFNRRTLDAHLEDEWFRHARARWSVALIMLDVDRFKPYNDTYGHQAGDNVLKTIAAILKDHARRSCDIAARYGGEEFTLVLPHTDIYSAYSIADSIRRQIEDMRVPHPTGPTGVVTASLGVTAVVPTVAAQSNDGVKSLYEAADTALYDAKSSGRNAVRTSVPAGYHVQNRVTNQNSTV